MPEALPAISLVAVPGRRRMTLELAGEIDRRGFPAIFAPSIFGNFSLCEALAHGTRRLAFATSIAPIYTRSVEDFAQSAAFLHEISGRRFRLGIGVSHAPAHRRLGVTVGSPLTDIRGFIAKLREQRGAGDLPPLYLAALRKQMVRLAGELADGLIFANAARSHIAASLAVLPAAKRSDPQFTIANMIPTCICDDLVEAKAVHRRTLTHYALLPNYRNYWKEAGYVEEMEGIEAAIREDRIADVAKYLTDAWLADCTLFGPAGRVRDGLAAWRAAGVRTPVVVPSSARGNQIEALHETLRTFAP
jgi:alkanesulfonate monooxygenase SsuD/methylene tetrahydromethanopterin reductase-like flavin-dependent oxidoreductase (luciferase family)